MTAPYASYIALGDSMSIDLYPGPNLGAASLLYRNDDERFPEFAGRDLESLYPGLSFVQLARDGATTHEVEQSLSSIDLGPGRVLFTLTVGGNDLLRARFRDPRGMLQAYRDHLAQVLDQLLDRYGDRCRIVQATIYDPTDGVGDLMASGIPSPGLVAHLARVNDAIRDLAAARPAMVVAEAHAHFLGHGAHAEDVQLAHHHPEDPTRWLKLGIEPNERGGSEVRRVMWEAINASDTARGSCA